MRMLFVLKEGETPLSVSLQGEYQECCELDIVDLTGHVDYKSLLDKLESSDKLLSL